MGLAPPSGFLQNLQNKENVKNQEKKFAFQKGNLL